MKALYFAILTVGFSCLLFVNSASAETLEYHIFDNLTVGQLTPQNNWAGSSLGSVINTDCADGAGKCVLINSGGAQVRNEFATSTAPYFFSSFYLKTGTFGIAKVTFEQNVSSPVCSVSVDHNAGVIYLNGVSTGHSATTSVWYQFDLDLNVASGTCRVRINGEGTTYSQAKLSAATSVNVVRLASDGLGAYFDNILVSDQAASTTQFGDDSCPECTRIIAYSPTTGEVLASTTNGATARVSFYINEDDICEFVCETFAQVRIKHVLSNQSYTFNAEVDEFGYSQFTHFFESINQQGTYTMTIQLYNSYGYESGLIDYNPQWGRFDLVPTIVTKFHVGSSSSAGAIEDYNDSLTEEERETIENYENGSSDPGSVDSPGLIASGLDGVISSFLHLPPWGYVTVFNDVLLNSTSTGELGVMELAFPTSSPLSGQTFELDITGGAETGIARIRSLGVSGEHGDSFDTAMYYWQILWYVALVIWIIKELLGIGMVTDGIAGAYASRGEAGRMEEGKKSKFGSTNMRRGGGGSSIDMRRM